MVTSRWNTYPNRLRALWNLVDDLIFNSRPPARDALSRTFSTSALALLFFIGVFHWAIFFQFGRMSFDESDWTDGLYLYSVVRQSVAEGVIPYFADPAYQNWPDSRFLTNPQSILSPQMIFSPLMGVGSFVLVNTLILYSLGFLGCILIRNRYRLSLLPFTLLFLLFNFNGHITSHISAGHSMWNGYFLLPFYVLLVLQLIQPKSATNLRTSILLAFVLFGMVLQGSFHIFIWCLMFLFLLGLFNSRYWREVLLTILFSSSLALFRLVPTALVGRDHQASYASGFPTIPIFIDALTTIKAYTYEHPSSNLYNVGWWEHDYFIGLVGVLFIAYFGIYHRFSTNSSVRDHRYQALDLPVLVLVLFSFGVVFDLISDLRIPLLSWVERVPSRFFIIPLVTLIVISSIRMQALFQDFGRNGVLKLLLFAGMVQVAHSLVAHSWFWRIGSIESGGVQIAREVSLNLPGHQDTWYVVVVNATALYSLLTVIALCCLYYWTGVRARRQEAPIDSEVGPLT